ncbi:hypothetical protein Tco_0982871 [Tanacetum coccineum]
MLPRRWKKKSVKWLVEKHVAKAIEEYEKSRANLDGAGSSRGNTRNAGGTVNVQGCSHKTFINGKPHSFNGTKGVVGLRRWIEKVEIRVDDDLHNLRYVEAEFSAIVINNAIAPQDELGQDMALLLREQRHKFLRYEGLEYPDTDIADFEGRLARIHRRELHRVPVFDFGGLPNLMAEGLSGRILMEHRDEASVSVFTNRAWRKMLDIRGPLVHELILEFFSTFRFSQAILDLDTPRTLHFQIGGARRRISWRQFILALGLHMEEEMQTAGFGIFFGTTPSYTLIRDPILRLCHRLIACSIAGRSQTPEKVTVTDLFYLRWMDVDSVNVPYLLARYLRLFAAGRKSEAHISGRQFVARLAKDFRLLTAEILGGLTVIAPELPIIDMTQLVRLQICAQFDDTWAWVAMGPERQPVATAGAPVVAEDAPIIDEGGQADLAPEQSPQQPPPPPPAHARTMPQRMAILEEDVYKIHRGLTEQREVIDVMAHDFSRFSTWVTTGLGCMMDRAAVAYTPYAHTHVSYQRRIT